MAYKPRVCFDFDGVVHSYTSEWAGPTVIPDPPVPGAFECITELLLDGFGVSVFSTRSRDPEATKAMHQWMLDHGMDPAVAVEIEFPLEKPAALLYIDDRGFHFKGKFPTLDYIKAFKPWNRGGPSDV